MSTAAAAAATNNNNGIGPIKVRSANDRKRKAREQGGRGDVEEESKEISDEEEERSIEQLVWEDLWSDDFETVRKATLEVKKLVLNASDIPEAEANRKRIVEASGHVVMLKNVEKSVGDKERHEFIGTNLLILMFVSCLSIKRQKIMRKTPMIIETIVKIMQTFADRRKCCSSACGVLGNLADEDDDFKVKLFEAGMIPLAVESMKRFDEDKLMQCLGSTLLENLLKSEKETKKIVDAANACKALTVLSEAKDNFPDNQEVKESTVACIKILIKH